MGTTNVCIRRVRNVKRDHAQLSYAYNLDGSLWKLTYPSGRVVSYMPGGAGRPTAVTDSTGPINYVQGAHYAPFSGLADMMQGATPITIKNRYSCPANTNNQLTTCGLTYDAAGNVMINNGVTYTYDAENRLGTPGAGNGRVPIRW